MFAPIPQTQFKSNGAMWQDLGEDLKPKLEPKLDA